MIQENVVVLFSMPLIKLYYNSTLWGFASVFILWMSTTHVPSLYGQGLQTIIGSHAWQEKCCTKQRWVWHTIIYKYGTLSKYTTTTLHYIRDSILLDREPILAICQWRKCWREMKASFRVLHSLTSYKLPRSAFKLIQIQA